MVTFPPVHTSLLNIFNPVSHFHIAKAFKMPEY